MIYGTDLFQYFQHSVKKQKKYSHLKPNTHVIQVYVWLVISRNFWQKIVEVYY